VTIAYTKRSAGIKAFPQNVIAMNRKMTNLAAICLCALIWSTCPKPVPRFWFDLVSEKAGVAFDYDNQTHHGSVGKLLQEVFKNDSK
jgi:hypothetical protein